MNKENQITLDFRCCCCCPRWKTMLRCWRLGSETERAIIQSFAPSLSLSLRVALLWSNRSAKRSFFFLYASLPGSVLLSGFARFFTCMSRFKFFFLCVVKEKRLFLHLITFLFLFSNQLCQQI